MAAAGCCRARWTASHWATCTKALGAPQLVSLGFGEDRPTRFVSQAVNEALTGAVPEAGALLLKRFGAVTLSKEFHQRMAQHKAQGHKLGCALEDGPMGLFIQVEEGEDQDRSNSINTLPMCCAAAK